ncbi:MAG: hypothetical protein QM682_02810 [Paracoccus sp. (in: a-proteobacteria)]|uniref:hypothetical protein n=1 Tax=Paracoccus sp. TaxID=267 RepID=UPI0039E41F3D
MGTGQYGRLFSTGAAAQPVSDTAVIKTLNRIHGMIDHLSDLGLGLQPGDV